MGKTINAAAAVAFAGLAIAAPAARAGDNKDPILSGLAQEAARTLPWDQTVQGVCEHFQRVIIQDLQDIGVKTPFAAVLTTVSIGSGSFKRQACAITTKPDAIGEGVSLNDVFDHKNGLVAEIDTSDFSNFFDASREVSLNSSTASMIHRDMMRAMTPDDQKLVGQKLPDFLLNHKP